MNNYCVTISNKRTEYYTYYMTIKAKSLEEAKKKAQKIVDNEDEEYMDEHCEISEAGDAYDEYNVEEVRPLKGGKRE